MSKLIETRHHGLQVVAFSHKLVDFSIAKGDTVEAVLACGRRINFGATDCSLPMVYAQQADLEVDAFIILTDNETCGSLQLPQHLSEPCTLPLSRFH